MNALLLDSVYFGIALSLLAYWAGVKIKEKTGLTICNPLLIAVILVIAVLKIFSIDYYTYNQGAQYITYFLKPATVCLAVPLYRQMKLLKKHARAILLSVTAGCLASAASIVGLSLLFGLDKTLTASLIPKSLTTAIAIGVSEEIGGLSAITVMAVVITGLLGAVFASAVFKLLKIRHPVAQGLACGTSAHALGTSKALEIGEIQGAMSGLAIIIAGLFTVILAPLLAYFI